jgi:crotonobetainyl-CoA:carnitine CoA-transferase CaiB-like acyl-CoA transferase
LSALIEEVLETQDVEHWVDKLDQAGLPCGPINTLDQVLAEPQVSARQLLREIDHPTAGQLKVVGVPIKFSATPGDIRCAPPLLGEDTDSMLTSLGYTVDEIDSLRRDGVI